MSILSLHALLPLLTSDHYGSLGHNASRNLCRILKRTVEVKQNDAHRESHAINLIVALGKVGEVEAIDTVVAAMSRLPTGPGISPADKALIRLIDRKHRETARASLLRGAEQPITRTDELLRASRETNVANPDQLLRTLDS